MTSKIHPSLHCHIKIGRNRQHIIYIILNASHLFSYISFPWQVEHVHSIVNHHKWVIVAKVEKHL